MTGNGNWSSYFKDFVFQFGFYGPGEYGEWLTNAGFSVKRLELNPKDMTLKVNKELSAWLIASIMQPYTQ